MRASQIHTQRGPVVGRGLCVALILGAKVAAAAPCPTDLPNSIYGGGGAGVNPQLSVLGKKLRKLKQPINVFYSSPSTCTGYDYLANPGRGKPSTFLYWPDDNAPVNGISCDAAGTEEITFSLTAVTPFLCGPLGAPTTLVKRFVTSVSHFAVITNHASSEDSISSEALSLIYGGTSVAPWSVAGGIRAEGASSPLTLLFAGAIGVSPARLAQWRGLSTAESPVDFVDQWHRVSGQNPDQALAYASGASAWEGEASERIKVLAYQHVGQSCGYLPDSDRGAHDKRNVRTGQYYLSTTNNFYAKVDEAGVVTNEHVRRLLDYWSGSVVTEEVSLLDEVIASGDVPLCAVTALRAEGDLSPFVSYAPERPCHGYYEFKATGATEHEECSEDADCNARLGEKCRGYVTEREPDGDPAWLGFCEAY